MTVGITELPPEGMQLGGVALAGDAERGTKTTEGSAFFSPRRESPSRVPNPRSSGCWCGPVWTRPTAARRSHFPTDGTRR